MEAEGNGGCRGRQSDLSHSTQSMFVFITLKVNRSLSLFISADTLGPFKTQRLEHEHVAFAVRYSNSLVCKQTTTISPLLLVSAQLVNILLFLQNEFAAKYRLILS